MIKFQWISQVNRIQQTHGRSNHLLEYSIEWLIYCTQRFYVHLMFPQTTTWILNQIIVTYRHRWNLSDLNNLERSIRFRSKDINRN